MKANSQKSLIPGTAIRGEFPFFDGPYADVAFLDSAASAQKPRVVIESLKEAISIGYANTHRGAYAFSAALTEKCEAVREKVANLIGAPAPESIVFTRGTTEAINLAAHGLEKQFSPGDVILLTMLEHHSNIVPWQLLAERKSLKVVFANISDDGRVDLADLAEKVKTLKPKLIACTHLSNALGTVAPVMRISEMAKQSGAYFLIDGAQGICHAEVNVSALGCDFYAFSAHKLYGPTGVGVLYIKPETAEKMQPFMGGGNMISTVTLEGSTWAKPPHKFEAGTQSIGEIVALGTAIDWLSQISFKTRKAHETELLAYGVEALKKMPEVQIFGPYKSPEEHCSIISFTVTGVHPHDLASIADANGVQIRAGHHCTQPLMKRLGVPATARMSIGIYSRKEDVDRLVQSVKDARQRFAA